jgi:hypothetical protein
MNQHEAERRSVDGKNFALQVGRKHPYRVITERTLPGSARNLICVPSKAILESRRRQKNSQNSVTP